MSAGRNNAAGADCKPCGGTGTLIGTSALGATTYSVCLDCYGDRDRARRARADVLAKAIEAWRAIDSRDREAMLKAVEGPYQDPDWKVAIALLRAAAEPEAKVDVITRPRKTTLCEVCGKDTVYTACCIVEGILYHQKCQP